MARISAYIKETLPEPAASQAITLFNNYLAYKKVAVSYDKEFPAIDTLDNLTAEYLTERLDTLSQVRSSELGDDVAAAFFGQSEIYDRVEIEKLRINNSNYSDQEKRELSLLAEQQLPQQQQLRRQKRRKVNEMVAFNQQLNTSEASADEIFAARASQFGNDFAQRMAITDSENAKWKARVEAYQQQKQEIIGYSLEAQDKLQLIDELRAERFSATEIKRIIVME